jgi:hypothetical protein
MTNGSPPPNSFAQRYQQTASNQQKKSPSPTVKIFVWDVHSDISVRSFFKQLNRTSSYKRALVQHPRTVPPSVTDNPSSEFDNLPATTIALDRRYVSKDYSYCTTASVHCSQSSDHLNGPVGESTVNRSQGQHTAYILQQPNNGSSVRNRVRDRKNQSSLRQSQKSASTSSTMLDDLAKTQQQSQMYQATLTTSTSTSNATAAAHMRSLDRRHIRGGPHNASIHSTMTKVPIKSSHTDIYGSLERNKHSKVSQPSLHGTLLNDENDHRSKADHQAHDFYHLTSNGPSTSTIVNVGNALQKQSSFDQIDSIPPPIPPALHRSRRPAPSVFQPHFEPTVVGTTVKDSYYTISGSKDISTHPHTNTRGLLTENFYNGPYNNKPPTGTTQQQQQQQQQTMHRYDTSPLLVRRLDHSHLSQSQQQSAATVTAQGHSARYPSQSYNRTQSSSTMSTSQPPLGRSTNSNSNLQPSALLFRPHSSQSSSSHSSGLVHLTK